MNKKESLKFDLVVIGAGMSGISAAITAARQGVKVCLLCDRPVLGGNASSEIRMWIRGASAHFPYYKEGGLCEEIALDNAYYNPDMTYPLWDMVLLEKIRQEKNISLYMNTFCMGASADEKSVKSVKAIQTTTYTEFTFEADYFIDCSGDAVLADCIPVSYRVGREGKDEFQEVAGKEKADSFTMGNSCLFALRETDRKISFTPPAFAKKFTDKDFEMRLSDEREKGFVEENYWWIELGGEKDALHDAEEIKYELLATVYGVYDYVKNSGKYNADNWDLDFVGFFPAKRETRRYIGLYTLTQTDVESATVFADEVAYGGWSMDDHSPYGMNNDGAPNKHYFVKQPYGIPLRCLISKDYDNLGFAGRNISVTHMALSSTRVMATCMTEGQAIGMAVAMANGQALASVLENVQKIKQALRNEDCYLLNTKREISSLLLKAKSNISEENKAVLFNGIERALNEKDVPACFGVGESVEFTFDKAFVKEIRLVFDSDFIRECQNDRQVKQYPQRFHIAKDAEQAIVPPSLVKAYTVEVLKDGAWTSVADEGNNWQRVRKVAVNAEIAGLRFIGKATHGAKEIRLYSMDCL